MYTCCHCSATDDATGICCVRYTATCDAYDLSWRATDIGFARHHLICWGVDEEQKKQGDEEGGGGGKLWRSDRMDDENGRKEFSKNVNERSKSRKDAHWENEYSRRARTDDRRKKKFLCCRKSHLQSSQHVQMNNDWVGLDLGVFCVALCVCLGRGRYSHAAYIHKLFATRFRYLKGAATREITLSKKKCFFFSLPFMAKCEIVCTRDPNDCHESSAPFSWCQSVQCCVWVSSMCMYRVHSTLYNKTKSKDAKDDDGDGAKNGKNKMKIKINRTYFLFVSFSMKLQITSQPVGCALVHNV